MSQHARGARQFARNEMVGTEAAVLYPCTQKVKTFKASSVLLGILTIGSISLAQDADKHTPPPTAVPLPSSEMQSLTKALAGKWATTYEFVPGVISPSGGTGTGEEVWRASPGGYVLMEEEHASSPEGEFFLIAFHWWDK